MRRQAEVRLGLLEGGKELERLRGATWQSGEAVGLVEPRAHVEIDASAAVRANRPEVT